VHDDLQRSGRRRLVLAAAAGVVLLSAAIALLVFLPVVVTVLMFTAVLERLHVVSDVVRALLISVAIGMSVAVAGTAIAWRRAERAALISTQLQLATTPGTTLRVVPSWRVSETALPRLRRQLDTIAIAAGVRAPECAVVVDPAPNLLSIGRTPDTAWIVCTTGLLDELPPRELEAVLAYELGRVACQEVSLDTVVYACTARTFEVCAAMLQPHHGSLLLAPFAALALPLVGGCALLRRSALRAQARLSDGLAVQFCRDPVALLAALRRLDADPRTVRFAGTPNAHLWLQYPHTRASRWLLGTGRLLEARIRRLERMTNSIIR
jgi:Zn-dependent protease with chaperone function